MEKPQSEKPQPLKFSTADLLALERTVMANERTFLAYIRTSLTLVVPGVTGVQLADTPLLKIVSALFVPLGILVFIVGTMRFLKKKKVNYLVKREPEKVKDIMKEPGKKP